MILQIKLSDNIYNLKKKLLIVKKILLRRYKNILKELNEFFHIKEMNKIIICTHFLSCRLIRLKIMPVKFFYILKFIIFF